jgi:hypothetical protein
MASRTTAPPPKANPKASSSVPASTKPVPVTVNEMVDQSLPSVDDIDFGDLEESEPAFLHDDDLDEVVDNEEVRKKISEGVDIAQYLEQVETQLYDIDRQSVLEYLSERENFAVLYNEMAETEKVLAQMEKMLNVFQSDIGTITSEILKMQKEAKLKELQVEQRRQAEQDLSKFINSTMLPDNLRRALMQLSIDESYVIFLKEYSRRLTFISQFKGQNVKAVAEFESAYTQLTITVCERILEWINQKFSLAFTDLESLSAVHKQLAKFRFLFTFLGKNWPEKGTEVINYYVNQTKTLYYNYYRLYAQEMKKSQLETVPTTKEDLLAHVEGKFSSLFKGSAATTQQNRLAVFTLGRRAAILTNSDKKADFPTKIDSSKKYPFEYLFRCINFMFLNDVSEESLFNLQVLSMDLTENIFDKACALIFRTLEDHLDLSYDMIGMMLLLIMVWQYRMIMADRKEPCMTGHLNQLTEILANRFRFVFEQNVQSVTNATPEALGGMETQHTHYVVKRYSEFLSACMYLLTEYPEALKVLRLKTKLPLLRSEIEKLVTKMGASYAADRSKTMLCLLNNYDAMHQVTLKYVGTEHEQHFRDLVFSYCSQFADSLLNQSFAYLVKFVKDNASVDPSTQSVQYRDPTADPRFVEDILKKFHGSWKKSLKDTQQLILSGIPNNTIAHKILEQVFKDVYFFYRILMDIVKQFYKTLTNSQYLLAQTELQFEIRSYLKPNSGTTSAPATPSK